jgi:hypothetical protein
MLCLGSNFGRRSYLEYLRPMWVAIPVTEMRIGFIPSIGNTLLLRIIETGHVAMEKIPILDVFSSCFLSTLIIDVFIDVFSY